eukprot:11164531-Lingulodinium_polyedra.AAC.1
MESCSEVDAAVPKGTAAAAAATEAEPSAGVMSGTSDDRIADNGSTSWSGSSAVEYDGRSKYDE